MSKKTFYVLMAVSMVSIPCFSAQERVVTVQNSVRLGYDDNLYLRDDAGKEGSGYITDILTINGKFNISAEPKRCCIGSRKCGIALTPILVP